MEVIKAQRFLRKFNKGSENRVGGIQQKTSIFEEEWRSRMIAMRLNQSSRLW